MIQAIYNTHICWPQISPSTKEIIRQVALKSLAEFSIACALFALCAPFAAPGGVSALAIGLMIQTAISIPLRIWTYTRRAPLDIQKCQSLLAWNFTLLSSSNIITLIHELGHFTAIKRCIPNAAARIILRPFQGGVTIFAKPIFLAKTSYAFIVGAGPVAAVAFAALILIAALSIHTRHPEIGNTCLTTAVFGFVSHAAYALDALRIGPFVRGHDFSILWGMGIHPLAAAVAIIAIPILIAKVHLARQGN